MKTILFSVSYAGLWGQDKLSLEEFIPHAAELGYKGVELMCKRPHLSPLDWKPDKVKNIKRLCDDNGLEVACLAAYTNFTGGIESREVPFNEFQILYIESLAELAQVLDCGLIRIFTSYERDDMSINEQWSRTVAAIQECCDRVIPYGVTIGIQNHHDIAVATRALRELLNDINRPNCKLMFDPWTLNLRGEELFNTAKEIAPDVVYTTMADYIRMPRYRYQPDQVNYLEMPVDMCRAVPMSDGDMDNLSFIKGLQAGGYDGPIAYEMCSPLRGGGSIKNLDYCAKRFIEWLDVNGLA